MITKKEFDGNLAKKTFCIETGSLNIKYHYLTKEELIKTIDQTEKILKRLKVKPLALLMQASLKGLKVALKEREFNGGGK